MPSTRIIYVLNKVDLTTPEDALDKAGQLGILESKRVLPVSARTGYNVEQLKGLVGSMLYAEMEKVKVKRVEEGA